MDTRQPKDISRQGIEGNEFKINNKEYTTDWNFRNYRYANHGEQITVLPSNVLCKWCKFNDSFFPVNPFCNYDCSKFKYQDYKAICLGAE
jgi:hypothetical protein